MTVCRVLFDAAVRELGAEAAREIITRYGGSSALLVKRDGWLSLSLVECFANEVTSRVGEKWLDRAVERATDRAYGSMRTRLLRLTGTPASAYQALPLEAERFNRVVSLAAERLGDESVRLTATPREGAPREGSLALCRVRLAQARLLPTLFDRGEARVLHTRCLQHGDEACVYEVSWSEGAPDAVEPLEGEPLAAHAGMNGDVLALPGPSEDAVLALVVAHDAERRAALATALSARYRVTALGTAHRALAEAAAHGPDVVLSAASLPDMTGEELCVALRSDARTRGLPLLVLRDGDDEEATLNRTGGVQAEPNEYLRAAIPDAELLARVDLHVGLRRMTQGLALSERRAMLGVTAASVAHQLRNPLTTMIAGLPAMRARMRGRVDPQTFDMVDVMIDCAERIERLTRDLMDLSRVDREASGAFSPSDGLRSAVRLARARTFGGVAIDDQVQDCAPTEGRAGDINHVFLNLLDNALRAVGDSGRIRVTAGTENGCYVTRIADSGAGVSPEISERIFEPFFTTRKAGEGTGLGLAIARQIMRQHGGDIVVSRSELGGALFTVQLPITAVSDESAATMH